MPDNPLTHHVGDQPEVRVGHHHRRGPIRRAQRPSLIEERAEPIPQAGTQTGGKPVSEVRATIVFARRQSDKPFWPLGLCIAWVMRHDLVQAVKLFARRRLGLQYDRDEWATARTKLMNRLGEGRIQAFGLTPRGESALRFQRWNGSICGSRSAARTKRSAMKAVLLHIVNRRRKVTLDRRPKLTPAYEAREQQRSPRRSWSGLRSRGERGLARNGCLERCAGQSRPKPRGGTIAWSSLRSSSQIARNASAVALS